jgi:hypothetical protein
MFVLQQQHVSATTLVEATLLHGNAAGHSFDGVTDGTNTCKNGSMHTAAATALVWVYADHRSYMRVAAAVLTGLSEALRSS